MDQCRKFDSSKIDDIFSNSRHPIRINEPGHIHFVTTSCYKYKPFFCKSWTRQIIMESIDKVRSKREFLIIGYVVMPEHAHFLIVPNQCKTISAAVQCIKWYTSTQLLAELRKRGKDEKKLWQPRFYDFNVFTQKKLLEKLNYCHMNPVNRGLVDSPDDWLYSSYRNYECDDDRIFRVDRWWVYWNG